jgi:hypothetical protein
MDMVSPVGYEALNIFSSKTFTPSPRPLPVATGRQARGEGVTKMNGIKERTTKGQRHKAISTKPKFQQVNEGDGE